ncbi:hopanoid biosynthesis associated RND transporter like protein HpnN [Desulfocurvibacter africanus PCS]|uniref:Hopanoid biosynthesis associated RND transporter like protein HpnN n=1 Tax=Desulfocurvibacter africanus PCS TaxID=1262666 RepID=M5PYB9_DESAF|nr:MMPL family transporter [Desulfocurvibacter africanus]EMG39079.1 hopanoid biosynthesis associated RND transporter like protein HpnN [Desulfocurvibacter africanus PCS]
MPLRRIRKNIPCMPRWVVQAVLARPGLTLLLAVALTGWLGWYTVSHFAISTDMTEMVSDDLPFRQMRKKLDQAFPGQRETLVAVVESDAPEMARAFQEKLAVRLRRMAPEAGLESVFAPGADEFFRRNGILLRELDQVEETVDNLAGVQPFLTPLAEDLSLPSLLSTLGDFLIVGGQELEDAETLPKLFASMHRTIEGALQGRLKYLSWQELMRGDDGQEDEISREFVVVRPRLDYGKLNPGRQALQTVRTTAQELAREVPGVRVRLTGNVALKSDDLRSVENSVGLGFALSFIAVAALLYIGLASWRMVLACLATLLMGLTCTLGFAMLAIGRLNLISVAFVVLYIGLGIDYAIQYSLSYRENMRRRLEKHQALAQAAEETGNALMLCSVTTALGFYSFVPTAYIGASELGLISGTGMFIILAATMTVLPAMFALMPTDLTQGRSLSLGRRVSRFPARRARLVTGSAAVLIIASLALLPGVHFDANPLDLSDQDAESVVTARDLFRTGDNSPWNISLLAHDREEAAREAARLAELPEVARTVHIGDFLPTDVEDKLAALQDLEFILPPLPPAPEPIEVRHCEYARCRAAFENFGQALETYLRESDRGQSEAAGLLASVRELTVRLSDRQAGESALRLLEQAMLQPMAALLESLRDLRRAEPFGLRDLPPELLEQYVSPQGVYLVQAFPSQDLSIPENQRRFVDAVRAVDPEVTGPPVAVLESGQTISGAFLQAMLIAVGLISLFLLLVLRSARETALMLMPLTLAILYTLGAMTALGIAFNFANIIVVPLILGIGVDYSIHLVQRYRSGNESAEELLGTATARGVLFSALTTTASFVSLAFSPHDGMAGMGLLLTVSIGLMLLATLMILPAVLALWPGLANKRNQAR